MKKLALALATATLATLSAPSIAATATATMPVTATVVSSCLVAATPLVFGIYNGTDSADKLGSSTVTLACAGTTTATIELDNGAHASGGVRNMIKTLGTDTLSYGLFKPTGNTSAATCGTLTTPYGSVAAGLPVIGLTVAVQSFPVCGSIPAGQAASLGAYTDTVTVTVTF